MPLERTIVAQVEILSEQELPGRWQFDANVLDDHGQLRLHTITLTWADYNRWSADGTDQPSRVVDAAVHFLLMHIPPADLPDTFDASLGRRRFGHRADQIIPTLIGR